MKKIIKYLAIIVVLLIVIFKIWVYSNQNKEQIPVIMYHNVVLDEYYDSSVPDTISVSMFEKQLKYFKDNGYQTLDLDTFYCWKKSKCTVSKKSVLLTFDDGFYSFHYLVEPLLEKYDMHAVSFVIGHATDETTNEYNPKKYGTIGLDLINSHSEHVEYQSHSYDMHRDENGKHRIYVMTKSELQDDLDMMNDIAHFKYISYPFNTDTDEFIKLLSKNGYKLAFRGEGEKATKSCNDYQISRIGVKTEFEEFKKIFESKKYNNRYGNGLLRKVFVTIERKIKIRLG